MIQLYLKFVFALILTYSFRLFCMFDYLVTCNARLKIGLSIEKDIDNLSKDFLSCLVSVVSAIVVSVYCNFVN